MDRRLLLTAGVRADRSSTNGDTDKFFFYPKAAASYRFIRPFGGVDEIKLRGAYGQTGNQPLFGSKFSPDTTGTIGGIFGDAARQPGGRSHHPAGAADGVRGRVRRAARQRPRRAELHACTSAPSATCCWSRPSRPAAGQELRDLQLGQQAAEPRRRGGAHRLADPEPGRELALPHHLLRQPEQGHRADGAGVPDRRLRPCRWAPSRSRKDSSATQIFGHAKGKVGDANPGLPDVASPATSTIKRFTLGFLFDWKQGGDIINLTEFLYDARPNSMDYLEEGGGADRPGRFRAGITKAYVQDGSYLKLREVNLAYNLPESRSPRASSARSVRYARLTLERPEPAPLHRLPRPGSRGEQLRQPGDRAEHRRGPVPAEPQLLLLDRLGVLTMTPITRQWHPVLLLARPRRGSLQTSISHQSQQPRSDRGQSDPSRGRCRGGRHAASRSAPTSRTSRWTWAIIGREVLPLRRLRSPVHRASCSQGPLDPGSDAFGGDHWADQYAAIRERQHDPGRAADRYRADRRGAERDVGVRQDDPGAQLPDRPEHPHPGLDPDRDGHLGDRGRRRRSRPTRRRSTTSSSLLEQAKAELQAGGPAFPFSLPAGFTGFNTPATFLQFNRALRARVAVYRSDFAGGAHRPGRIVHRPRGPLDLGVYMDYGTGAGDLANPLSIDPQQGENFAHPSLETGAQLQVDGVTLDQRFVDKIVPRPITQQQRSDLGPRAGSAIPTPGTPDPDHQERGADPAPGRGQHRTGRPRQRRCRTSISVRHAVGQPAATRRPGHAGGGAGRAAVQQALLPDVRGRPPVDRRAALRATGIASGGPARRDVVFPTLPIPTDETLPRQ